MHAVELLEQAIGFARKSGFRIRQEWLGGTGGGVCEFGGDRWLFIDLSLDPQERLERVLSELEGATTGQLPDRSEDRAQRGKPRRVA